MKRISPGEISVYKLYGTEGFAGYDIKGLLQAQLDSCEKELREKVKEGVIKWIETHRAKASVFVTFDTKSVEDCVLIKIQDLKALKQKHLGGE